MLYNPSSADTVWRWLCCVRAVFPEKGLPGRAAVLLVDFSAPAVVSSGVVPQDWARRVASHCWRGQRGNAERFHPGWKSSAKSSVASRRKGPTLIAFSGVVEYSSESWLAKPAAIADRHRGRAVRAFVAR